MFVRHRDQRYFLKGIERVTMSKLLQFFVDGAGWSIAHIYIQSQDWYPDYEKIVADIVVAEGIFGLDMVEKVKKLVFV